MRTEADRLLDEFSTEDILIMMEMARAALNSSVERAYFGIRMDLSDEVFEQLKNKLEKKLNP